MLRMWVLCRMDWGLLLVVLVVTIMGQDELSSSSSVEDGGSSEECGQPPNDPQGGTIVPGRIYVNVREPTSGARCRRAHPLVQEIVWRCEDRICCHSEELCSCDDPTSYIEDAVCPDTSTDQTTLRCYVKFNTERPYQYICCPGYIEDENGACIDVDECTIGAHDCAIPMICVNSPGSYTCASCAPEYYTTLADGTCRDIDECSGDGPPVCSHGCVNTDPGYHCTCPEGFQLDAAGGSCQLVSTPDPFPETTQHGPQYGASTNDRVKVVLIPIPVIIIIPIIGVLFLVGILVFFCVLKKKHKPDGMPLQTSSYDNQAYDFVEGATAGPIIAVIPVPVLKEKLPLEDEVLPREKHPLPEEGDYSYPQTKKGGPPDDAVNPYDDVMPASKLHPRKGVPSAINAGPYDDTLGAVGGYDLPPPYTQTDKLADITQEQHYDVINEGQYDYVTVKGSNGSKGSKGTELGDNIRNEKLEDHEDVYSEI